jgi:hypothetical protein
VDSGFGNIWPEGTEASANGASCGLDGQGRWTLVFRKVSRNPEARERAGD